MKPDYDGASILNLIESVAQSRGAAAQSYAPLQVAHTGDWQDARAVVLLVVDGLGAATLRTRAESSFLRRHAVATLTSVFPTTTASAVTTYLTGLAPRAHGLTGWHMWFEEIDQILAILPLTPRAPAGGSPAYSAEMLTDRLLRRAPLTARVPTHSSLVSPRDIAFSPFNRFHTGDAGCTGYHGVHELVDSIATAATQPGRQYIYAYYSKVDALSHVLGVDHPETLATLDKLDLALDTLAGRLKGSDTLLLVSADHGFIKAPEERLIELEHHPELVRMLARPLCGERRLAYAYVKPGDEVAFERQLERDLGHAVACRRSVDLLEEGWFGPAAGEHPRFRSRIGTHTLILKDDWTIRDTLAGERRQVQLGVHGGTSADEMEVPLIAVPC